MTNSPYVKMDFTAETNAVDSVHSVMFVTTNCPPVSETHNWKSILTATYENIAKRWFQVNPESVVVVLEDLLDDTDKDEWTEELGFIAWQSNDKNIFAEEIARTISINGHCNYIAVFKNKSEVIKLINILNDEWDDYFFYAEEEFEAIKEEPEQGILIIL